MPTHCRFCGAAVRPNTMFCSSCGQIIAGDDSRPASAPPFAGTDGGRPRSAPAAPVRQAELPPVPLPSVPVWADAGRSAPAQQAPAPVPLNLVLPDGAHVSIEGVLVLGRQPSAGASERGGVPVEVADPSRSMSRVHLIVAPTPDGGASATDPGSGNGTVVVRAGTRHQLAPDSPVALARGDRLILGDVAVDVA